MAPIALPERAVLVEVLGMEGEIVVGRQREVVRDLDREAELRGAGVARHEEARPPLHRRVGVLEVRQVHDRHAQHLELRVLVGDGCGALVVDDARGADAPQRRHARVVLARRELAALVFGDVAFAPVGTVGGNARVVLRDDAQRLDEGVAEIVERLEPVGPGDAAVGVLELGIALGDQLVDVLVVDHLIGGEDVVVVIDLDVALGDHPVALGVVEQLIGLQVERLRAVDLLARTEHAALGLGEGLAGARLTGGYAGILGGGGASNQRGEEADGGQQHERARQPQSATTAAASKRSAAHIVRYRRATHHSAVLLV